MALIALFPLRPRLQQRQILLREIGRRRVRRQHDCALPIRARPGAVIAALAQYPALQQCLGIVGINRNRALDIRLGLIQPAQMAPCRGAPGVGVGALAIERQGPRQIVDRVLKMLCRRGGDRAFDQQIRIIRRQREREPGRAIGTYRRRRVQSFMGRRRKPG